MGRPKFITRLSEKQRFLRHVQKRGDGCWIWTGSLDKRGMGYGRFALYLRPNSRKPKGISAHRAAYRIFVGSIPSARCVCHRCDVPQCVNPSHLFLGTQRQNLRDAMKKGRMAIGVNNGMAKLSEDQVREIRRRYSWWEVTMKSLATEYGVSRGTIWRIIHANRYASVV